LEFRLSVYQLQYGGRIQSSRTSLALQWRLHPKVSRGGTPPATVSRNFLPVPPPNRHDRAHMGTPPQIH
jgi:hypothetical protein